MTYIPMSGPFSITGSESPLAVTGTFWPATQPVSAASLPLPTGAATAGKQDTLIGLVDGIESLLAGNLNVVGNFYPATQPVSGTVTVSNFPATQPVSGTFWPPTQPVSGSVSISGSVAVTGTFWQTTQPVSIAATVAVSGPVTDAQLRASALPVSLAALPALAAGNNTIGMIKDHAQGSRVVRNFILDVFTAAPVAEAMQQVVQWYNNAAVAATAQPAVIPAGKILRLTGGRIETKSLATVGSVVMRVRINTGGLAVIGSSLAASAACGSRAGATTVAMTGGHDHAEFSFGDEGLEIPAGAGVGFSLAGYGPTGTLTLQGVTRFEVWGYEYTA